ncbi:hypothetical protein [Niallia taxi]|uniref:hypothetical protein n=1 Tax=Niallia taxi TaxID=2499688 RepID=UPI00254FD4DE|nr:hypothetical protein [Niallia taxi]MDK8642769.1 hypothetical protein [Niallia taxi]
MDVNTLFVGIDTSTTLTSNLAKRKKQHIKRVDLIELSPSLSFATYKKENTIIRTYFFKDAVVLFVEATQFLQDMEEVFGLSSPDLDVMATDLSHEALIPKFEKALAEYNEGTIIGPFLHLYGQRYWHDDSLIIGNREALVKLKNVIDMALTYGEGRTVVSSSDWEGYDLYVKCLPGEPETNKKWDSIQLPYHDREMYVPDEKEELDPYKLLVNWRK